MRDLPPSLDLLALARELLLAELAPLLPSERRRDAHLVATAMAIAAREAKGEGWQGEVEKALGRFYSLSALQGGEGGDPLRSNGEGEVGAGSTSGIPHLTPALSAPGGGEGDSLHRFAADLRNGAFETNPSRSAAARAILWRSTIEKLREGNPHFLAANGFGRAGRQGT